MLPYLNYKIVLLLFSVIHFKTINFMFTKIKSKIETAFCVKLFCLKLFAYLSR